MTTSPVTTPPQLTASSPYPIGAWRYNYSPFTPTRPCQSELQAFQDWFGNMWQSVQDTDKNDAYLNEVTNGVKQDILDAAPKYPAEKRKNKWQLAWENSKTWLSANWAPITAIAGLLIIAQGGLPMLARLIEPLFKGSRATGAAASRLPNVFPPPPPAIFRRNINS